MILVKFQFIKHYFFGSAFLLPYFRKDGDVIERCGVAAGRQHELAVPHRVHHRGAVVALPDPRAVYGRDEKCGVKG